eukprot:RCo030521
MPSPPVELRTVPGPVGALMGGYSLHPTSLAPAANPPHTSWWHPPTYGEVLSSAPASVPVAAPLHSTTTTAAASLSTAFTAPLSASPAVAAGSPPGVRLVP